MRELVPKLHINLEQNHQLMSHSIQHFIHSTQKNLKEIPQTLIKEVAVTSPDSEFKPIIIESVPFSENILSIILPLLILNYLKSKSFKNQNIAKNVEQIDPLLAEFGLED